MITVESIVEGGRRARGFFRDLPVLPVAEAIIADQYWDDDQSREPDLRRVLAQPRVAAIAYPTLGHPDVLQVFLKDGGEPPVFACVLVTSARLRAMLEESSPVIEGFALQVLPSEHLSLESMRAGLQAWIERCFADLVLPGVAVERWTGPHGIFEDLLRLLLSQPDAHTDTDTSDELQPDPSLAQPPYELAA